uniref:LRRNT_2 domain-containing protein n=1 Tax=Steinernema glaseri TaxID=37863 RepID=A0A1I8ACE3_9BILA
MSHWQKLYGQELLILSMVEGNHRVYGPHWMKWNHPGYDNPSYCLALGWSCEIDSQETKADVCDRYKMNDLSEDNVNITWKAETDWKSSHGSLRRDPHRKKRCWDEALGCSSQGNLTKFPLKCERHLVCNNIEFLSVTCEMC